MTSANETRAVPAARHRAEPRYAELPLHAELYLLAHDDDTGKCHLNEQALAIGLAGALLLELAITERVAVGWVFNDFDCLWHQQPGQLFIVRHGPTGSPLLDAALAAVDRVVRARPHGEHLRIWLRSFAANDLYERVRGALITAGLINRAERRRYLGFGQTVTYLPVDLAYPTRVRARVRDAIAFHEPSDYLPPAEPTGGCVALCGLTLALELTEFLYRGQPNREINHWLHVVVNSHGNETISDVIHAVDAGRGDIAVAAMR